MVGALSLRSLYLTTCSSAVPKGKQRVEGRSVYFEVLVRSRRPSRVLVIVVDRNCRRPGGRSRAAFAGTHVAEPDGREGGRSRRPRPRPTIAGTWSARPRHRSGRPFINMRTTGYGRLDGSSNFADAREPEARIGCGSPLMSPISRGRGADVRPAASATASGTGGRRIDDAAALRSDLRTRSGLGFDAFKGVTARAGRRGPPTRRAPHVIVRNDRSRRACAAWAPSGSRLRRS